MPAYQELLEFLDLRAQGSESSVPDANQRKSRVEVYNARKTPFKSGAITSFVSSAYDRSSSSETLCGPERHPLYACPKFRGMQHDMMISTLKSNGMCFNCLGPKHFTKDCKSMHRCKVCQKSHHSLLHVDRPHVTSTPIVVPTEAETLNSTPVAVAPRSALHIRVLP